MKEGDIITFGNQKWVVLEIMDGMALAITKGILEIRWYHNDFKRNLDRMLVGKVS
ncbi:MAG TPA: hypothetical protein VF602_10295 [Pedobacter sp.]